MRGNSSEKMVKRIAIVALITATATLACGSVQIYTEGRP